MSSFGEQIVWPEGPTSTDGKRAPVSSLGWGARVQGDFGAEGEARTLLTVPELKGLPQAIGVNLFRSDRQATLHNSDVRARVTFSAAQSGQLTFDCDWRGGFCVHASRLDVQYVGYKIPAAGLYVPATQVILAATAGLNGARPSHPPTYTVLPDEVLAGAFRTIEVPLLARRVALLMRYAYAPTVGGTGDAPLASTFLSFADAAGNALSWIDALSSRAAAFGEGIPVPAGASFLALSNATPDALALGAVFHLGL